MTMPPKSTRPVRSSSSRRRCRTSPGMPQAHRSLSLRLRAAATTRLTEREPAVVRRIRCGAQHASKPRAASRAAIAARRDARSGSSRRSSTTRASPHAHARSPRRAPTSACVEPRRRSTPAGTPRARSSQDRARRAAPSPRSPASPGPSGKRIAVARRVDALGGELELHRGLALEARRRRAGRRSAATASNSRPTLVVARRVDAALEHRLQHAALARR